MSKTYSSSLIGRTKCAIVFDSGGKSIGLITEIVAKVLPKSRKRRLVFKGPVRFKKSNSHYLEHIILSLNDRVIDALNIPRKNYEINIVNPGATTLNEMGVEVSGFSAGLPTFLTIVSASLQIPLKQGIVSTGHVASTDGDVVCVRGIPAKIDAAIGSPDISEFVAPDLDREDSPKLLTPNEYEAATESLSNPKDDINIYLVDNVLDAMKVFFSDEAIVIGALKSDFFYQNESKHEFQCPIQKIVDFLTGHNEKRFWDVLEFEFFDCNSEKIGMLLLAYVQFHIRKELYPEGFGEHLLELIVSLPPVSKKRDGLFPLFPMELIIRLSQYASKNDHDDLRKLYQSVLGEGFGDTLYQVEDSEIVTSHAKDSEKEIVEWILNEISQENISRKVGQPLDEAAARFNIDSITIKNGFKFNELITAYFNHLYRHTGSLIKMPSTVAVSAEAVDLVKKAFARYGGYAAALAEGKNGINGGMRMVFDKMTEFLKVENREKYTTKIFMESIDPLDWDAKVRLAEALKERIEFELPNNLKDLSPKQLANHLETIIQTYSESMNPLSNLLRRL